MAVLDHYTTQSHSLGFFGRISKAFAALRRSARDRRELRETRRMLSMLSDRELMDIGICRGDIRHLNYRHGEWSFGS